MKRRQRGLYEGNFSDNSHGSPSVGKIVGTAVVEQKWLHTIKQLFVLRTKIPALVVVATLVWGFVGQIILPPEYRLSTFLGSVPTANFMIQ